MNQIDDFWTPECKICLEKPNQMVRLEDGSNICNSCFNELDQETYKLVRIKRDWCPEWLWSLFSPIIKYPPFKQIFTKKV